jgi:two-component system response regulator YesN
MYKVLIVDDDNNVRNGLKVLVPWGECGFEIIETAVDGKDALDKYGQKSFDLIVVDIQMPRMDGLEFIAAVRGMDPFVHFLVLTGHAEFGYAKKAIEWKVDGYILKPIDEEELTAHLNKIRSLLQKEQEDKLFITGDRAWRCEMLIQSILSGNVLNSGGDLSEKASQIGLSWPSYQILLLQPKNEEGLKKTDQVNVRRRMKQILSNASKGLVFKWEAYNGVLLNESITETADLEHLYNRLIHGMEETGPVCFFSIGQPVAQIADISESYETAARLLKNRFIAGTGQILSTVSVPGAENVQNDAGADAGIDVQMAAGKLYYALDIGNRDTIRQLVCEWESRMVGSGTTENRIKTTLMLIINAALNKLSHAERLSQTEVQECMNGLTEIYSQPDLTALRGFVLGNLNDLAGYMDDGNNEAIIKKVEDIIERNYSEKLTLETLAGTFNYSSGYLGRLFKKYAGESFNTYVDKIRIQKAKELLGQGMKVYEVAKHIGYSNVDYFHSKFRKYAGISPSCFRKDKSPDHTN